MEPTHFKFIIMTSRLSQQLAKFVREKRISMGLSQTDFSYLIYGNKERRNYIGELELGKREISVQTLDLILTKTNSWIEFVEQ